MADELTTNSAKSQLVASKKFNQKDEIISNARVDTYAPPLTYF